jgi:hypothetical protein
MVVAVRARVRGKLHVRPTLPATRILVERQECNVTLRRRGTLAARH